MRFHEIQKVPRDDRCEHLGSHVPAIGVSVWSQVVSYGAVVIVTTADKEPEVITSSIWMVGVWVADNSHLIFWGVVQFARVSGKNG